MYPIMICLMLDYEMLLWSSSPDLVILVDGELLLEEF